MKKAANMLALLLSLALLTGCGAGLSGKPEASSPGGGEQADPAEPSEAPRDPAQQSYEGLEETLIFDRGGIRITAKGLDFSGPYGPELGLRIENNSAKDITVQPRNVSVNGYMIGSMLSAEVAAGSARDDNLTLLRSYLTAAGITTVADVEFSLDILDPETWEVLYDSRAIRLKTDAAEDFSYVYDDEGEPAYAEDGLEIVVKGISEDASWFGPSVVVYINNAGESDVTVQVRGATVNGAEMEPVFSCDVAAGKRAIDTVAFLKRELRENDIETIERVEFSFLIFDMHSWETIAETEPVAVERGEAEEPAA